MPLSDYEVHDILGEYAALGPTPAPEAAWPALPELRRGRRRPVRRPPTYVSLVERDGLALWQWGFAKPHSIAHGRRAHAAGGPVALKGKEIFSDIIQPLGVNQISQLLLDFDVKRNPDFFRKDGWKLRQWHGNSQVLRDANPPGAKAPKNILLIVHGTASCCDHILSEIKLAEGGGKFLSDAARHYSAVLAFEHPTISMSPVLNALDLSAALEPYGNCNVDIVCHSRGGLVASWWMHVVDRLSLARNELGQSREAAQFVALARQLRPYPRARRHCCRVSCTAHDDPQSSRLRGGLHRKDTTSRRGLGHDPRAGCAVSHRQQPGTSPPQRAKISQTGSPDSVPHPRQLREY